MISEGLKGDLNFLLGIISQKLDLSISRHKLAAKRYKSAAVWLSNSSSILNKYSPDLYSQGSFSLGTIVKPINSDDFDLDFVCLLKNFVKSPMKMKNIVGDQLHKNPAYKNKIEELNRGWRIIYKDKFHMDILPAKPNEMNVDSSTAILAPDSELKNWSPSDPIGYKNWFHNKMATQYNLVQEAILREDVRLKAIGDVPEYRIKTTLQQVVQLLKRNRDIYFGEDNEFAPISIIITTLAAHSYQNNANLFESLLNIGNNMKNNIIKKDDVLWVTNPVNLDENFAEKWEGSKNYWESFQEWNESLIDNILLLENSPDIGEIEKIVKSLFGESISREALKVLFDKKDKIHSANTIPPDIIIRKTQPYGNK